MPGVHGKIPNMKHRWLLVIALPVIIFIGWFIIRTYIQQPVPDVAILSYTLRSPFDAIAFNNTQAYFCKPFDATATYRTQTNDEVPTEPRDSIELSIQKEWINFDAIRQPLTDEIKLIYNAAQEASQKSNVEAAQCAANHMTQLTKHNPYICDTSKLHTEQGTYYNSFDAEDLAMSYLAIRHAPIPDDQRILIETWLQELMLCQHDFTVEQVDVTDGFTKPLWNGFYNGVHATISLGIALDDVDTVESTAALLADATAQDLNPDGTPPNEIETKQESALFYMNGVAHNVMSSILMLEYNNIDMHYASLEALLSVTKDALKNPQIIVKLTGYQQTRPVDIWARKWAAYVDYWNNEEYSALELNDMEGFWVN